MPEIISSADFQEKVLNSSKPVLVDFFASWCAPCHMLAPTLDELATEVEGRAEVYKIDIDKSPDMAQRYGVTSVPTLIAFEDGAIKNQTVGAKAKAQLLDLLF